MKTPVSDSRRSAARPAVAATGQATLAARSFVSLAILSAVCTLLVGIVAVETVRITRSTTRSSRSQNPVLTDVVEVGAQPELGPSADRDVIAFVRRWVDAIASSRGREAGAFYADRVAFSGATRDRANVVANWVELMSDATAFMRVDMDRIDSTAEIVDAQGVPPACRDVRGASGSVMRLRLWASSDRSSGNRWVPCRHLEGAYVLRLRNTSTGFVICHEYWSLTDAICTSCPNAPACPR